LLGPFDLTRAVRGFISDPLPVKWTADGAGLVAGAGAAQ
jgi:hypothetical protein